MNYQCINLKLGILLIIPLLLFHLVSSQECNFFDSVNLENAIRQSDGSYLHDDIVYPPDLIELFEYEYPYTGSTVKEITTPHLRGCICELKPCIQLCCPKHQLYSIDSKQCENNNTYFKKDIRITEAPGHTFFSDIFNNKGHFGVKYGLPCDSGYFLSPEEGAEYSWEIYPDGRLNFIGSNVYSRNEYCLSAMAPEIFEDSPKDIDQTRLYLNPFICYENQRPEYSTREIIHSITMLFSVPFMIITIIVYAAIPELRNLHGKTLISYLSALSIAYIILSIIKFPRGTLLPMGSCQFLGFTAYYTLITSFFWLSVMSFDLWWNFRGAKGLHRTGDVKKFLMYSAYAWGSGLIMLIIALSVQKSNASVKVKPGILPQNICWLDTTLWIQFFYLFGPIVVIITFNTVVFVATFIRIRKVQKEMSKIMAKEDSKRNLENEKDNFALFLRLFVIMGVTWGMETLSMLVTKLYGPSWIFNIIDVCNGIQGFLIFILFVLKKKVKNLVIKRYREIRGLPAEPSKNTEKTSVPLVNQEVRTARDN